MTSHADYSESESTYSIHYFRFQEHVERFLLLTFVLRHPGWGTLLQEAIGDVPLDCMGRIFTTGVTIMGSHFQ